MKTVLIVEDEKMIRKGLKTMVERSGVTVQTIIECNNGEMALEILNEQPIDVMFTDIRMPKMSGIDLVKAMQECEHIPLTVAVSGYDDFSYAVEMMHHGVKEYLLKPVDREKVREILQKLDQEIRKNEQQEAAIQKINYQQFKDLLLQESLGTRKTKEQFLQFEGDFFQNPYVVLCRETQENAHTEWEHDWLCLDPIENRQIWIVEAQNAQMIFDDILQNSCVGESKIHQGLEELRQAYLESCAARNQAYLKGLSRVVYSDKQKIIKHTVDTNQMHQIVQMLATDRIEDACQILRKIVWEVKREYYSLESFSENIGIFLDSISATYSSIPQADSESLDLFRNIYIYRSLDEYIYILLEWMYCFHDRIRTLFETDLNKYKMQKAVEYVKVHFSEELNMAIVSNHLSMNYSLFSQEFKQYTGKNFVTYLRDMRLNEAKRLLSETDWKIIEISKKVGYENEKHFMKLFKEICGVSPTEYRKTCFFQKK